LSLERVYLSLVCLSLERVYLSLERQYVANVIGFSVPVTLAPLCHARYGTLQTHLSVPVYPPDTYQYVAERALERERSGSACALESA